MIRITRNQLLSEVKKILKTYNLRAFKSYSQNFVIDPRLIQWHIQYADLGEEDIVVEIGAGLGTLTKYLAENAKKVLAIEYDPKLVAVLQEELSAYKNIEVIEGDILKIESQKFEGTKIISNTPYKISSPLTFKIIQSSYILAVMSYQKEFADRMIADHGSKNFGRITLGVKYYANVEYLKDIPKNFFYPIPRVDSALIRLTPSKPPFQLGDEKKFFEFIRSLYSFRKKSVKAALSLYLKHINIKENDRENLLNNTLATERIFRLKLDDFYELYNLIQKFTED
ncbi:MAG TPA: 16S rRNA (adenine(1518)-N(6)/adenine(1519)-N(6))-dimethyltransferase RsmA [Candidatus Deferrimicrobium sp.]|nr:16S rRNA (adenine(1518)-N(6)/adenine(1519)-N(6))-dimethyltransferase RsmA [Candidatus Deferrimicrobium sp.]